MKPSLKVILALVMTSFITSTPAQEVMIPDLGLNAAIRDALQKPVGPLTEPDLLSLTLLSAGHRSIASIEGLESARNLGILELVNNSITNFTVASALTNLSILELFGNHLTSFVLSNASPKLTILDIAFNSLAQCSLPAGLTNLDTLFLEGNVLTNFTLPAGLTALRQVDAGGNLLTRFTVPADMTNLLSLALHINQLTNLTLPGNLRGLATLELEVNRLTDLQLPAGMTNLNFLDLHQNQLTNLTIPADFTNLGYLNLSRNQLTDLNLPTGLSHLTVLNLYENHLTSLTLPLGMTNLAGLFLPDNQLTNLVLAPDLIHLFDLDVSRNSLTSLTLPPGLTQLNQLTLDNNPLTTLVLSEPLAATNLAATVVALRNQGVQVFTYPLAVRLTPRPPQPVGAFRFTITGPPGDYAIVTSTNLVDWNALGGSHVPLGSNVITDFSAQFSPQKFYRAVRQIPPANMVFVAPNTFTMGSPTNDFDSSIDERPQTTVTLTHGFWIGKYEVTEAEYLSVIGVNPSNFPDDLNRAVSSVSWFDATNYCALLTQRELAAGRILPGSRYRLPTEAEWECAARAGTTNRFSYGDDPFYTSTTNYAWFLDLGHPDLIVHPVGQKLPNPWGLYDVHGNVWEWCLDNYGPLPGGVQIDPTGPASTLVRDKVARGGAYDYPNSSCRSATRLFRFPLWPDSDVGFRVVLAPEP